LKLKLKFKNFTCFKSGVEEDRRFLLNEAVFTVATMGERSSLSSSIDIRASEDNEEGEVEPSENFLPEDLLERLSSSELLLIIFEIVEFEFDKDNP